MFWIL